MCAELINSTLEHGTARYYTNSGDWEGRESSKFLTEFIYSVKRNAAMGKPTQQIMVDARARGEAFGRGLVPQMMEELSKVSGFVLIEGNFRRYTDPNGGVYFSEEFSNAPRPISFRFRIRDWGKAQPITDGMKLRVYGNITHQLGSTDYIEVNPVAIF
jgi:hypothetical protein